MARKDLLKSLMTPQTGEDPPAPPAAQRKRGAIGAVSKSIAELKSNAIVSLDPNLVGEGGLKDRLEHDEADHARLVESIRTYGQQVPVLVRPHPGETGRYQIVYGRRRVLAARDLGIEIKALVRDLDEDAVILAQGQENTARRDLSFIEKVNFARQMAEAGYARAVIGDALSVDKTVISRMLKIAEAVPRTVIEGIGAAPAAGRDRWTAVAERMAAERRDPETLLDIVVASSGPTSDARFETLYRLLAEGPARPARPAPAAVPLTGAGGAVLGEARRTGKRTTLALSTGTGFETWLVENMERIHREWRATAGEAPGATGEDRAVSKGGRTGRT